MSSIVSDGVGKVGGVFFGAGQYTYHAERAAVVVQSGEAAVPRAYGQEDVAIMLVDETQLPETVARDVTIKGSAAKSTHSHKTGVPESWHVDYTVGERTDNFAQVEYLAVALADKEILSVFFTVSHHATYAVLHAFAESGVVVAYIAATHQPDVIVAHWHHLVNADADVARNLGFETIVVALVVVRHQLHVAAFVDAVKHLLYIFAFGIIT